MSLSSCTPCTLARAAPALGHYGRRTTDATYIPTNTSVSIYGKFDENFDPPVLGFLGLSAIESFETIIDYVHRRLILIRLDRAGRRLAKEFLPSRLR